MVRLRRVLPRNSRNTQKLLAEKSLPQMRTDAHRWLGCVGFSHGIHGTHRNFWRRRASHRCTQMVRLRRVLPRNSRNTQKLLAEKSLPQMRTDAHRWLGCVGFSHGIHGTHRNFWRRRASHRCTQMVRLRRVLPRNSRNSQKLLVEKSLPRMRTDAHRWLGCVGFSHGIHRTHRSFYQGVQQSLLHQPSTRAPTL